MEVQYLTEIQIDKPSHTADTLEENPKSLTPVLDKKVNTTYIREKLGLAER